MSEKTTDWFAPKAADAMTEDCNEISVELPGVAVGDLRFFRLPPDAAADRIDAVFKNGLLKIAIAKLQPAAGVGQPGLHSY
jgi:hypothetical protein